MVKLKNYINGGKNSYFVASKQKVSICLDQELLLTIEQEVAGGLFRSRSHLIEYLVGKALRNGGVPEQPEFLNRTAAQENEETEHRRESNGHHS